MPPKKLSEAVVQRNDVTTRLGFDPKQLTKVKVKALTDVQKAKILEVSVGKLKTQLTLTPAAPLKSKSYLTLYSAMMVYPIWPDGTGEALFSSAFQGAVFPGAQVEFPRMKKGSNHLVEFNVQLNMNVVYKFRIFHFPLGGFQDIQIQGPKTDTLIILAPPIDEISGDLELGASIQQRNTVNDNAGWALFSVRVTTVS
jgi:hypothetical protein